MLYVGKSKNVRSRVKSYFYGDERKKAGDLLAETVSIDGIACASELESLVLEARLIREHEPKYNRRGKTWRRYAYLKIDPGEAFPRIRVVREPKGAAVFLGPFATARAARLAKDALEDVFEIRRCTTPMRATTRFAPCALADMGRCLAPCDGRVGLEPYEELVRSLISSLSTPDGLLAALEARMHELAEQERFEEAALARDRLRALAEALARSRADRWLLSGGEMTLRHGADALLRLRGGDLDRGGDARPIGAPSPRDRADEAAVVRSWIARNRPRLEATETALVEPVSGGAELHRLLSQLRGSTREDGASAPGDVRHIQAASKPYPAEVQRLGRTVRPWTPSGSPRRRPGSRSGPSP